jgi:uncharacterized iron-regulated membrane protein
MRLLDLLHRWTGGIAGLLLAVIGLSGTVLVWEGAWIALPGAGDEVVSDPAALGASVAAALEEAPGLSRITFASEEIGLHQAIYADGSGAYFAQDGALVDRWTTMWERPELWLFDLHHYMFMGEFGKNLTGVLGLLLLAFAVTGLILWWRTRRTFRFRLWPARMTRSAIVRQHRDIGAVAAPLLILSAATGAMMIFPAISTVLTAPWASPGKSSPDLPTDLAPAGPEADWATLMTNAQAAFPGAAPRRLMFPAKPGAPLTLRLRQPFEWTPNGRTYVWLDPASGAVLATDDPASGDMASAIAEKYYPLHAGKVGGLLWQLALTFAGLALVLLGTLATWSFWFRRPRPATPSRAVVMQPAE